MTSNTMVSRCSYNKFKILFAAVALLAVGFACGSKEPLPLRYVGVWTGADGTTITIRPDGTGDYRSSSSSVTGGTVTIDEAAKTLKVALAGQGPTLSIEMSPSSNRMKLDGVFFKKTGDLDPNRDPSKPEIPSDDQLQTMVKATFLDFGEAVQTSNFTAFHKNSAKVWQDKSSPTEMLAAFKDFVDNKARFDFKTVISPLDAKFFPEPEIEDDEGLSVLSIRGYYPTKPLRTNFVIKYTMDAGIWKVTDVNIKPARD